MPCWGYEYPPKRWVKRKPRTKAEWQLLRRFGVWPKEQVQ